MYCRHCGTHNVNDQTYCKNCGKIIKSNSILNEKSNIIETKTSFCRKCGTQVFDRYCPECGTAGYDLEIKQGMRITPSDIGINKGKIIELKSIVKDTGIEDIKSVEDVKKIIARKPILKESFISAIKILGIGLLVSLVIFFGITKIEFVEELMYEFEDLADYVDPQMAKMKPNFLDLFNLSLLSPFNMSAKVAGDLYGYGNSNSANVSVNLSFKILFMLLIPVIALIAGQWKLFRNERTSVENMKNYALTSLMFSILVKITAILSQRNIKIDDYIQFKLKIAYHDLLSLVSVFLIIFVFHIILNMIIKRDNPFAVLNVKQYPDLGNRIISYVKSMGLYALIISASLLIVFLGMMIKDGEEFKLVSLIGLLIAPNVFINSWLLPFGYGLTTAVTRIKPVVISIFKTWKGIGTLKDNAYYDLGSGPIWGYLLIIFALIGIVYIIYKVVKDVEREGYFIKLGLIAAAISIVNAAIAYLVSMTIKVSGNSDIAYELGLDFLGFMGSTGTLKQSYSFINIIIVTCIWVFAIGAINYYLRENHIYGNVTSVLEQHRIKFVAGYGVIIVALVYLVQTKLLQNLTNMILNNLFPLLNMF